MDELIQKIDGIFKDHKLIGNYDFNEEDFSKMLNYVSESSIKLINQGNEFEEKYYKLIFATLVEIAKRWKNFDGETESDVDSSFWEHIYRFLLCKDLNKQRLYNAFTGIISQMGCKYSVPCVSTGKKYYSTLMMHSFAPKDSIFSFFDLCYNIFKKDLDLGFTKDDEWLCDIVAAQMKNVFSEGGYSEDKKVSIGSSAYSIKIGLRSFSLNSDLSADFVIFIKDTFYKISKMLNREKIEEDTRLNRYIIEWWKNKTESEGVCEKFLLKKRVPTVSKQNIVLKFFRDNGSVFLSIPPIRLDDVNSSMRLTICVNEKSVYSEEMRTRQGELVTTTTPIRLDLNNLLKDFDKINIRAEIKENDVVIFDSEQNKTTSLKREFLLFEDEKEVLSQINTPTNYFIYSKDIDALKSKPSELTTYSRYLYNIYPKAGESLVGEKRQVIFVDKIKTANLGETACLLGDLSGTEWLLGDIACTVYRNNIKLMIPENANLKALELRIDKKAYNLQNINYEGIESGCYQFGLRTLGLILDADPTSISLYSYEKEKTILTETVIVLPDLDIQFNHKFYYNDTERKLIVRNEDGEQELTWSNKDDEIKCPLNDGTLLIKVAYLRWRINGKEWYKETINKKMWYKELLTNGDLLEIDLPVKEEEFKLFCKSNGTNSEIARNQNGKYDIGRTIYINEGKTDISVYLVWGSEHFEFFTVATKEHFTENPLSYSNGKVYWNAENTFLGYQNDDFFLIVKSSEAKNNLRTKINEKKCEIKGLKEDVCDVEVKIKEQNIFLQPDCYKLIYEGKLCIGSPEKLRFTKKKIKLLRASCSDKTPQEWISFRPEYFVRNLKFVQENEIIYYSGQLCVIKQDGSTKELNFMENENGETIKINPVRIELRDKNTLWLVAGWEGGDEFLGELFCDKHRNGICNIQKQNDQYDIINLFKFREMEDV